MTTSMQGHFGSRTQTLGEHSKARLRSVKSAGLAWMAKHLVPPMGSEAMEMETRALAPGAMVVLRRAGEGVTLWPPGGMKAGGQGPKAIWEIGTAMRLVTLRVTE